MDYCEFKTNKERKNNFGFLRLLFATMVVVSHSPELLDGNRSREILTRLFGTMSFGEVGVHGFFIISGYLITKSFVESRSTGSYLTKRFLRIFPGYLVRACRQFVQTGTAYLNGAFWLIKWRIPSRLGDCAGQSVGFD